MAKKKGSVIQIDVDKRRDLEVVIEDTISHYHNYIYPDIIDIIKMKTSFSADIEVELQKNDPSGADHSYEIYPILEPNVDAFVSNAYDIDTVVRTIPIKTDIDSISSSKHGSDVLSYCEAVSNIESIETLMRREATILGTSYKKLWYQKKNKDKLPHASHVSFFEMFVEPGCKDFDQARYKIHRQILSDNQIKERYDDVLKYVEDIDTDVYEYIKSYQGDEYFFDWDFNMIWNLKFYESDIRNICHDSYDSYLSETTKDWKSLMHFALSNQFKIFDDETANGNNEVVELWEGGLCHLYINRQYMSSYQVMEQSPFTYHVYEPQPGTHLGRGLGHKLMSLQKEANSHYNNLRRIIRQSVNPDVLIQDGAIVDPVTQQSPSSVSYQGGKTRKINPTALFGGAEPRKSVRFTPDGIEGLLVSRLNQIMNEAQIIAGTSSYMLGGQGKVERVSGGIAQKNSTFLARLKPMVASIHDMKSKDFYIWMEIAKNFISEDIIISIDSEGKTSIKDVNIDDIINKTYVQVDMDSNKGIRRFENVTLGQNVLGVLGAFANVPDAQPMILKVMEKVIKDYAYDEFEQQQEQQNQISQDSPLMQQTQPTDADLANISQFLNNKPIDAGQNIGFSGGLI